MKILILGVNGFIGSHLTTAILSRTDWHVYGMDVASHRVQEHFQDPRFSFIEGDIAINHEWIEYHVKKCDVCLPLVAIATPAVYVQDPLAVFELDFEQNLRIVRQCLRYGTRIVFPSTSEVYGASPDPVFNERTSPLVYGPIHKERWIYACSKQLLDRVIWAMGRHERLRFSIIRPFNWIGPGLDSPSAAKEGSSRVVTQFLWHLVRREPIVLVDGGRQRRSFTYISDGIDCLMRVLENDGGRADGQIFNIGNPENDMSIRDLARRLVAALREFEPELADAATFREVDAETYYNDAYEDMVRRVPDIGAATEILGWRPQVDLDEALRRTTAAYCREWRAGALDLPAGAPGGGAGDPDHQPEGRP